VSRDYSNWVAVTSDGLRQYRLRS